MLYWIGLGIHPVGHTPHCRSVCTSISSRYDEGTSVWKNGYGARSSGRKTDRQKKWTLTKKVDLNSKFGVETFLIGTITTEQWQFHTRSLVQYNLQSFDTRSVQMVIVLHMNHQIHPHTGDSSQMSGNERVGNFLVSSFFGVQIETVFSSI